MRQRKRKRVRGKRNNIKKIKGQTLNRYADDRPSSLGTYFKSKRKPSKFVDMMKLWSRLCFLGEFSSNTLPQFRFKLTFVY